MGGKKKGERDLRLADLLGVLDVDMVNGESVVIKGVKSDSRNVKPGDVFVAVRGTGADGHRFVPDAIKRGAAACVTEEPMDTPGAANVVVEDTAKALALLAAEVRGNPSIGLRLVGVTGTNGKTSTAHLFRAICEQSQIGQFGIIGTVGHGVGGDLSAAVHTTPEPLTLHKLLGEMKDKDCVGVVMEVSSHAVRQQRTWGLDFEIGMLTNITRDHLDYHSTLDDYVDAKREFCYSLVADERRKKPGILVYSLDDENVRSIGRSFPGSTISTSVREKADVYATDVDATIHGTQFLLHLGDAQTDIALKLLGGFSASNAVMAAAAAHGLGVTADQIKQGLESVPQVPGRFEALGGGDKPLAVVDYSHTPDSLERTLVFCRALKPKRLIVVFGCGGDRDRGKRPVMGKIAERLADVCYVTSDNPRTENPAAIIEDILEGMGGHEDTRVVEPDRRKAIRAAVAEAQTGDLVAICGKGHEDYQIVGTESHHFDDREEARDALNRWS